jgi:hypothetical protein
LKADRDLSLGGDLQHAGVHFRASKEVQDNNIKTAYLWQPNLAGPNGKVISKEMKWARLFFPIGNRFYQSTLLNHPTNPVEELSWRDYGRFGFFFTKELKKGESISVKYRLFTEFLPDIKEKPDTAAKPELGKSADEAWATFAK